MEATSHQHPHATGVDRIVPMCDLCRRVYDAARIDQPTTAWQASAWMDLRTFFKGRAIHHAQMAFARTYCDDCRRSCDLITRYREPY